MSLRPDDSRSPYLKIADEIRRMIRTGEVEPGGRLPSGKALEERFDVAPMTVRHALDELKAEGLIYAVQGRGTFVRSDVDPGAILTTSEDVTDLVAALGRIDANLRSVERRLAALEEDRRPLPAAEAAPPPPRRSPSA